MDLTLWLQRCINVVIITSMICCEIKLLSTTEAGFPQRCKFDVVVSVLSRRLEFDFVISTLQQCCQYNIILEYILS